MKLKSNVLFHDLQVSMPSREWEENYFRIFRNNATPAILNPDYDASEFFSKKLMAELRVHNHEMYVLAEINATTYSHLLILEKIMDLYSKVPGLSGIILFEFLKKLVSASLNIEEEREIKTIHESSDHPQIKIEKLNLYLMKLTIRADNRFFEYFEEKLNSWINNVPTLKVNEMLNTVFSKPYEKPNLSKVVLFLVRGLNNPDLTKQLIMYTFNAYKDKLGILLSESTSYEKWLYNIGGLYPYLNFAKLVPDVQSHRFLFSSEELDLINKEDKLVSELYANLFSTIGLLGTGIIEPSFGFYLKELKEKRTKLEQKKQLIFDYKNKLTVPKYLYEELSGLLPLK